MDAKNGSPCSTGNEAGLASIDQITGSKPVEHGQGRADRRSAQRGTGKPETFERLRGELEGTNQRARTGEGLKRAGTKQQRGEDFFPFELVDGVLKQRRQKRLVHCNARPVAHARHEGIGTDAGLREVAGCQLVKRSPEHPEGAEGARIETGRVVDLPGAHPLGVGGAVVMLDDMRLDADV